MKMDYRVLTEAERKYTFSQSQQLSMQTGLIGYLRADFGSNGNEFWTTWNDFRKDLKTDDFKKEFDLVINSYRFGDGEFLSGRSTMSKFCYEHPESSYEDDRNHYGVRVDTERYSYLMPRHLMNCDTKRNKSQKTRAMALRQKLDTQRSMTFMSFGRI